MKPTHDEIAAQMAAFLASGGEVKELDQIEDPKIAQAHYYNATDKIVARKLKRRGGKVTPHKMALMRSSRSF